MSFHSGNGVLLEGRLLDVSRHTITDVNKLKTRFYVLYVQPSQIHQRKFDAKGLEIEPNFSDTKKVNTGHLMSSYKVEAKDKYKPSGSWAFWYPESEMEKTELETGQEIRLKTKGNSPFIFSLAKIDGGTVTKCNFAGDENTGASWTDKIMANKASENIGKAGDGDGADDEEWDD
ncbi:hypothetical protein WMY93_023989 [Mugilogobius chulae]|uniref:Arpin n=1 Tax=Mugilogobius chulae TaxID=88201 RepID=A0AAW0N7B3_9GOBI